MHRVGFALPLVLSTPVTIGLLIAAYGLRANYTCAFHGFFPDYLFFDVPILDSFEMIISEWYIWLSLFWWLSQIWITSHIWTSSCERLAKIERIFVILTYDSLVIDQCLSLNRRKEEKSEYTGFPLNMVSFYYNPPNIFSSLANTIFSYYFFIFKSDFCYFQTKFSSNSSFIFLYIMQYTN